MHDVVMLPQLFRQNGWFTADVGKIFHNGAEFEDPPSWDLMETSKEPAVDPATVIEKHQMPKPRNHSMEWEKLRLPDDQTADGRTARRAGELIRQFAQQGKPFFLGVGFHAPHCPYAAPAKYFDLHDPAKIPVPTVPDGYAKTIPEAAWYELAAQVAPNERQIREYRAAYYACISFMDAQAGIVFAALDETRLWDNTVVVFLSDNGYQTGEHGMWHKMTLFDDGTRLPLIIHAPGANGAGRTCHGLVEFVDIYPTLAELCGVKAPPDLDGRSLASALDNPAGGGKQAVYSSVGRNPDRARMISAITYLGQSVRTERWRYTEWDEGRKGVELYDERADRRELHNLAGESGYDDVKKELHNLLHVHSFTVNSR